MREQSVISQMEPSHDITVWGLTVWGLSWFVPRDKCFPKEDGSECLINDLPEPDTGHRLWATSHIYIHTRDRNLQEILLLTFFISYISSFHSCLFQRNFRNITKCRRGFRGGGAPGAPPPPVQSDNDKGGGGEDFFQ